VAGFQAVVLETKSAAALVDWLKKNGYAYSPEIQAWAKPYVEGGWKITALKVAKSHNAKSNIAMDGAQSKSGTSVAAAALRLTFKTDRPLFPDREPDSKSFAETLQAKHRLLRIYFLAEGRYEGRCQGDLSKDHAWSGKAVWAGQLRPQDRTKVLDLLKLPETTGPAQWWLTEFEDDWAYQSAPGDVYFAPASSQDAIKRPPIIVHVSSSWPKDIMVCTLAVVVGVPVWRRLRRR